MQKLYTFLIGAFYLFSIADAVLAQPCSEKILVAVVAHADDEFLFSPVLAKYAREGADVHLIIATRGEKWAPVTDLEPGDEIASVRATEAKCAARALGINPPVQLSFDDGSLGQRVQPPWSTLSQLESQLHREFTRLGPDVVMTFGPEGGYGHPEHRLVGAVVTQLVQKQAEGSPGLLVYAGVALGRVPEEPAEGDLPWQPTAEKYLTISVPYSEADLEAVRTSFACYESQFPAEVLQFGPLEAHQAVWQGSVHFRPWFGAVSGNDLFELSADRTDSGQ